MAKLFSTLIIAFWAVMSFFYIKQEVIPALPSLSQPSYETFLKNKQVIQKTVMGIYFIKKRIGQSVTHVDTLPDGSYRITNKTEIKLPKIFSSPDNEIKMTGYSSVNEDYQLQSFSFKITSFLFNYDVNGYTQDDKMIVDIFDGQNTKTHIYEKSDATTLSNGFSPFLAMPNLSVGKTWTITMIDPIAGTIQRIKANVDKKEMMEWKHKEYEVYDVVMEYKNFRAHAWITQDGRILKQELLMPGLYFIRE